MVRQDRTPCVAFDLDMTLIDSRELARGAFEHLNATFDTHIDPEEMARRTALPLRVVLADHADPHDLDDLIRSFRQWILQTGADRARPLPHAHEALRRAVAFSGATAVVTSRIDEIAHRLLGVCGLQVDTVIGNRTGEEKAPALRGIGATCYVGDHPLDMRGARLAAVRAIGVLSGQYSRAELFRAGADTVIDDLSGLTMDVMGDVPSGTVGTSRNET